jgi:redox-sensitive bicupin YhaK (pirin superfamily)
MISIRRSGERHHELRRKQEVWDTFDPLNPTDALGLGFGTLERFNEDRLPPGAGSRRQPHQDAEMVTYVREGALAYEDSMGRSGVIHAGEFQRMTVSRTLRHSETNASRTDWAHAFHLWLRPTAVNLEPDLEQKRFSAAQRRGVLCVIASPDGRRGSLHLHQDALVHAALLAPGQHLVYELGLARRGWLQVVHGAVTLGEAVLSRGDGAGLNDERVVSLTACVDSEILFLDLGPGAAELKPPPFASSGVERQLVSSSQGEPRSEHL